VKYAGSKSRLRLGLQASALTAAAALGFLLAALPQPAAADGLLPTISLPSLPVTLPTVTLPPVLPTTTETTSTGTTTTTGTTTPVGTTTTGGSTTAAASPGTPPGSPQPGGSQASPTTVAGTTATGTTPSAQGVAGAIRLADGSISIPVTSVRAPNRLLLAVTVAPHAVQGGQAIRASVQIRDARGYVVRGASVAIRSVPAGKVRPIAKKRTAANGRAAFVVHAKPAVLRAKGRLSLLVNAADPVQARAASASRTVWVGITVRRR
jgi:hypothetical protein